jgi:hypothetical protein
MPIDFTDERTFPRRGRLPMAHFLWLARVFDKARAHARGTIGEYVYPCPIDRGVMARWGVTPEEFDEAARSCPDDAAILTWAQSRVSEDSAAFANHWLVVEKFENLDRQDREEGAFAN